MDINVLLKGVDCECGKKHTCDIDYVFIERNAINRLVDICKDIDEVVIVADENTFSVAGEKVVNALSNKKINKIIFPGDTVLVPNEQAISQVEKCLGNSKMIIAVGSGVIQDLCKYVSHFSKIDYLDVATAPSMDGYASDGAAMILGGMKVTVKAGLPRAILADTEILKNAPMDMIKAGYGDVIGKYSALNDWKIANVINGEYLCNFIYDLTFEQVHKTLSLADGLKDRNEESIKSLMEALVVIGILMSFAGSSRPASGSEHHFSHFFEITGILENTPYLSHGLDVAYSTVITAKIREELLKISFADSFAKQDEKERNEQIKEVYGDIAQSCIDLQEKIGNYKNDRSKIYVEKEEQIKAVLREMPTAEQIDKMLKKAKLDINEFYNLYSQDKIRKAVKFAKDLKDRFTVLWLNYDLREGKYDV